MTRHRLAPLFEPRSIAVIGASGRPGRPGHETLRAAGLLGWQGALYPVTPRYEEIDGHRCHAAIADLPETVDLAIVAGSAARLEADLAAAVEAGARSLVAYATPEVADDPELPERLRAFAREAGVPMLGPNTIGYVNYARGTLGTWVPPANQPAGCIAAILQSGSFYSFSTLTDPRLRFSFTAHPAQEASVTTAEIIDYALGLPETRVLGLYLETVRDPQAFVAALAAADARDVPVVVLKPGRGEAARSAIATHTGRLAAPDALIDAVFARHNVHRVASMDEWWTTLTLFSHAREPGSGGLAALTDSGGQRALLIDGAEALGVPLARFSEGTATALRARLAPDLVAENPVDFWGGEEALADHVEHLLGAALADDDTAIAMVMSEYGTVPGDAFADDVAAGLVAGARGSAKPVVAMSYSARQLHPQRTLRLAAEGIPVLDGGPSGLRALAHLFRRRDRRTGPIREPRAPPGDIGAALAAARAGAEMEALALLAEFGIAGVAGVACSDAGEVVAACAALTPPFALKTAEGHAHKADVAGVALKLADGREVLAAYEEMAGRLGPRVVLQEMAPEGVEVALGVVRDADYGAFVMAASGGTLVELLDDRCFRLAPLGARDAEEMVAGLKCAPMLDGYRGHPPADREALTAAILALSDFACAHRDDIVSVDINPLIVHPGGAVAVDALMAFGGP